VFRAQRCCCHQACMAVLLIAAWCLNFYCWSVVVSRLLVVLLSVALQLLGVAIPWCCCPFVSCLMSPWSTHSCHRLVVVAILLFLAFFVCAVVCFHHHHCHCHGHHCCQGHSHWLIVICYFSFFVCCWQCSCWCCHFNVVIVVFHQWYQVPGSTGRRLWKLPVTPVGPRWVQVPGYHMACYPVPYFLVQLFGTKEHASYVSLV